MLFAFRVGLVAAWEPPIVRCADGLEWAWWQAVEAYTAATGRSKEGNLPTEILLEDTDGPWKGGATQSISALSMR